MTVYVETNFLLEIVMRQEQSDAARQLLDAGRARVCDLRLPVFSIAEAVSSIHVKRARRNAANVELEHQRSLLRRSNQHAGLIDKLSEVIDQFRSANEAEDFSLQEALSEFSSAGELINVSGFTLARACELTKTSALTLQDALVLSAILADLSHRPAELQSIFVSRDAKAFQGDTVESYLSPYMCRYIGSYTAAANMIQSRGPA